LLIAEQEAGPAEQEAILMRLCLLTWLCLACKRVCSFKPYHIMQTAFNDAALIDVLFVIVCWFDL
jgi:hypothetical protein